MTVLSCDRPNPIQIKAVQETADWTMNWDSPNLGTDTIASSVWTVSDPDLLMNAQQPSFTSNTATVWLSGGISGKLYIVTNVITTAGGRTIPASFILNVVDFNLVSQ